MARHLRVTRCFFATVDEAHDRFTVEGDFNLKDLNAALNKAGYNGKLE